MLNTPLTDETLKHVYVQAMLKLHANRYWAELNQWLKDGTVNFVKLVCNYKDLVNKYKRVTMEQKYSGPKPDGNSYAIQLY